MDVRLFKVDDEVRGLELALELVLVYCNVAELVLLACNVISSISFVKVFNSALAFSPIWPSSESLRIGPKIETMASRSDLSCTSISR